MNLRKRQTVMVAIGCAISSPACALVRGVKTYEPVRAEVSAPTPVVLEAIEEMAIAEGWDVVDADADTGLVEVLTPVEESGEVNTRHRWFFSVDGDEILVGMRLEAQFDPPKNSPWVTTSVVCRGYEYLRERQQLVRVLGFIPAAAATLEASSSTKLASIIKKRKATE